MSRSEAGSLMYANAELSHLLEMAARHQALAHSYDFTVTDGIFKQLVTTVRAPEWAGPVFIAANDLLIAQLNEHKFGRDPAVKAAKGLLALLPHAPSKNIKPDVRERHVCRLVCTAAVTQWLSTMSREQFSKSIPRQDIVKHWEIETRELHRFIYDKWRSANFGQDIKERLTRYAYARLCFETLAAHLDHSAPHIGLTTYRSLATETLRPPKKQTAEALVQELTRRKYRNSSLAAAVADMTTQKGTGPTPHIQVVEAMVDAIGFTEGSGLNLPQADLVSSHRIKEARLLLHGDALGHDDFPGASRFIYNKCLPPGAPDIAGVETFVDAYRGLFPPLEPQLRTPDMAL